MFKGLVLLDVFNNSECFFNKELVKDKIVLFGLKVELVIVIASSLWIDSDVTTFPFIFFNAVQY